VSALLLPDSTPRRAFDKAFQAGKLVFSRQTAEELGEVLGREKLDRYLPRARRDQFLELLFHHSLFASPEEEIRASRDPDDDKFLALALQVEATCLITGDGDLLVLHPVRGIPILNPAQFLRWPEETDIPDR